jgi:hypothetical protein
MNRKLLKEILATHADQLAQGRRPKPEDYTEDFEDLSAADVDELEPLLNVAEQIQSTLKPIHPPRRFESNLKKELLTTAHLHRAEGYVPPNPSRDLLVLGAVFGFIISLAGALIAWQIYKHRQRYL